MSIYKYKQLLQKIELKQPPKKFVSRAERAELDGLSQLCNSSIQKTHVSNKPRQERGRWFTNMRKG